MITYGYVKEYKTNDNGTIYLKIRIPSIHGAYSKSEYGGKIIRNYTEDNNLPWYQSLLLPKTPTEGDIATLLSVNSANNRFIVIGLTGANVSTTKIDETQTGETT